MHSIFILTVMLQKTYNIYFLFNSTTPTSKLFILIFVRLKKSVKERQRKENKKKIARARHFLRVTYPIFCIVFVVGFWALGIHHFWSDGDGHTDTEVTRHSRQAYKPQQATT